MSYPTSPIKRKRRTKAELDALCAKCLAIIGEYDTRISIRHLFYRVESIGLVPKTENGYKNLDGHLMKWRRAGRIPWNVFVDSLRWYTGPTLYDAAEDALRQTAHTYRRNLWATQDEHVEIWTEKDAITSILSEAADPWGVSVFTCRGFTSGTSLYEAARHYKQITKAGRRVLIYYFGDRDPSGVWIDRTVISNLRDDHDIDIEVERVAVTPEQIEQYSLPTRPTKKTDSRAKGFKGRSVEIDTMRPDVLQQLVEDCITQHIDGNAWRVMQIAEREERERLADVVRLFQGGVQ